MTYEMKMMSSHVCCRIAGHLTILYFLTVPLLAMRSVMEEHRLHNPEVQRMMDLRTRLATLWNVVFQILYASASLVIDVYTLRGKEDKISPTLRKYRYIFYAGIIFPVACSLQMYWIVHFWRPDLEHKTSLRYIVPEKINYIVHALVTVYAFWELLFLPRDQHKKNDASWFHLITFNATFLLVVLYTRYVDLGVWAYDVLTATAGTLWFPVVMCSIWVLSTIGYHLQWTVKDLVWRCRDGLAKTKSH